MAGGLAGGRRGAGFSIRRRELVMGIKENQMEKKIAIKGHLGRHTS